jgi:hypothetical protein
VKRTLIRCEEATASADSCEIPINLKIVRAAFGWFFIFVKTILMKFYFLTGIDPGAFMTALFLASVFISLLAIGFVHFLMPKKYRKWWVYAITFIIMLLLPFIIVAILFRSL